MGRLEMLTGGLPIVEWRKQSWPHRFFAKDKCPECEAELTIPITLRIAAFVGMVAFGSIPVIDNLISASIGFMPFLIAVIIYASVAAAFSILTFAPLVLTYAATGPGASVPFSMQR
jgi:hypothetical protein